MVSADCPHVEALHDVLVCADQIQAYLYLCHTNVMAHSCSIGGMSGITGFDISTSSYALSLPDVLNGLGAQGLVHLL